MNNEKNCCSLQECVDLRWVAAVDLGGAAGNMVFLRCADLTLPSDPRDKKEGENG